MPQEREQQDSASSSFESPREKILCDLLILSLHQGEFRCLIEMNENDRTRLEAEKQIFNLFSPIRAPDITPQELKEVCHRLFSPSFDKSDIDNLFKHLETTLTTTSIPPDEIIDSLQIAAREQGRSWRSKVTDRSTLEEIQKAEKELYEAHQLKRQVLEKVWRQRRLKLPVADSLMHALKMIDHVLIPFYRDQSNNLKRDHLTSAHLVNEVQRRFIRLFGACTPEEEVRLKTLPERLKKQIKGQDAAIDQIGSAIHQWRKVPPRTGKPLVLFFAGGTGVGKSQTATHLAYELVSTYGVEDTAIRTNESNVKRINLNREKQGGIFGWEKTKAAILCHILHQPTSVIILEEWDKMGPEDKSSLLELLDGTQNYLEEPWGYSSTNGPFVDLSGVIVILTSNIDSSNIEKGILGCYPSDKTKEGEAFLSRVDAMIPFQAISTVATKELIHDYLAEYELSPDMRSRVEQRLADVTTTDARILQRSIQTAIFNELNS